MTGVTGFPHQRTQFTGGNRIKTMATIEGSKQSEVEEKQKTKVKTRKKPRKKQTRKKRTILSPRKTGEKKGEKKRPKTPLAPARSAGF